MDNNFNLSLPMLVSNRIDIKFFLKITVLETLLTDEKINEAAVLVNYKINRTSFDYYLEEKNSLLHTFVVVTNYLNDKNFNKNTPIATQFLAIDEKIEQFKISGISDFEIILLVYPFDFQFQFHSNKLMNKDYFKDHKIIRFKIGEIESALFLFKYENKNTVIPKTNSEMKKKLIAQNRREKVSLPRGTYSLLLKEIKEELLNENQVISVEGLCEIFENKVLEKLSVIHNDSINKIEKDLKIFRGTNNSGAKYLQVILNTVNHKSRYNFNYEFDSKYNDKNLFILVDNDDSKPFLQKHITFFNPEITGQKIFLGSKNNPKTVEI